MTGCTFRSKHVHAAPGPEGIHGPQITDTTGDPMLRYSVVIVALSLLLHASSSLGQERPDPAKIRGVHSSK